MRNSKISKRDDLNSSLSITLSKRKKKNWTDEEDRILLNLINEYGPKKWSIIAKHIKDREGK